MAIHLFSREMWKGSRDCCVINNLLWPMKAAITGVTRMDTPEHWLFMQSVQSHCWCGSLWDLTITPSFKVSYSGHYHPEFLILYAKCSGTILKFHPLKLQWLYWLNLVWDIYIYINKLKESSLKKLISILFSTTNTLKEIISNLRLCDTGVLFSKIGKFIN